MADRLTAVRIRVHPVVRSCFSALRQLRSVRRRLSQHALLTLIRAVDITKVDYCCSVLAGVSGHLLDRRQSVLYAAARLLARRSEHIAPLLRHLYWSRVPEQIRFRPCVLTYPTSKTCFPGPTRVHNPNDTSIGSAVFAQLTVDSRYTLQRAALFLLKIVPSNGGSVPRVSFVVELTGNNDDVHTDASLQRSVLCQKGPLAAFCFHCT